MTVMKPMPKDCLSSFIPIQTADAFMHYLTRTGDLPALGADAVLVYLVARHVMQLDLGHKFPSVGDLAQRSGISLKRVEKALQVLLQKGYIDYREDEYILVNKAGLADEAGQLQGEITWESATPASLFNSSEFRKIFFSGDLGGARIVHIEHLQVNLTQVQNHANTHAPATTSKIVDSDSNDSSIEKEPIPEQKETIEIPVAPRAPRRILTSEKMPVSSAHSEVESENIAFAESRFDTHSSLSADNSQINTSASTGQQSVNVVKLPEKTDVLESSVEQYRHLLAEYTQQAYQAQLKALEIAEKATDDAFRKLLEHDKQRPIKPSSFMMLFKQYAWESAEHQWQLQKQNLQQIYDQVLAERYRLIQSLQLPPEGEESVYRQMAVDKLKQHHPQLMALHHEVQKKP